MRIRAAALCAATLLGMPATVAAVTIDTDGRLVIAADDGTFAARISGRVHADANLYGGDLVDHESGAFIRRARIGVSGYVRNWDYAITFDNATDSADLKDAYLARELGPGRLVIGQFKQFQGFEELTSSNEIAFIERSHVSNVMTARAIGVGYHGMHGRIGYAVSGYNLREASDGGTRATDDGIGFVGRLHTAPILRDGRALHLGISYAHERSSDSGAGIRLRPAGRSDEGRFTLFDIPGERADVGRLNLEVAGIVGPFAAQAEWLTGSADGDNAPSDDFSAAYAQVSYALGGGTPRRYDPLAGRMRNPRSGSGLGAFELALRWQHAERDDVPGAELQTVDAGVNYYVNDNVRFMLNYTAADNDSNGDAPDLVSLRAQLSF